MRVRLARLFWIGAAALLGAAALVSLFAVLRGEFTETDGHILGTLAVALGTGGTALAGLALVEREDARALGWATALAALAGFAVLTVEVWRDFPHEDLTGSTAVVLVVALLMATARLLRGEAPRWLFAAVVALLSGAGLLSVWAIWTDGGSEWWGKVLASLWILGGLAWFLVPVLDRVARRDSRPRERVVGRGPGHYEVDLGEGELLIVRRP